MKRLLREPLLHFLVLGAGLFIVFSAVSKSGGSGEPGKIVITQGHVESMVVAHTRTWQRPPTGEELQGLIRDRVREEAYYREALALGLDKDDLIIRRRLRQKLEFLTDGIVAQAQPTDDELSAYLREHPDKFRAQPLLTFTQVYLNPEKHGVTFGREAARLLARLNRAGGQADVSALGDSLMLDHTFDALPTSEVAKLFGGAFAAKVEKLPPGQWQGPVESGYGLHLVFVSKRTEGRLPPLAAVREAVSREWANARRLETNEQYYQALLARYAVVIERPHPAAEAHTRAVVK